MASSSTSATPFFGCMCAVIVFTLREALVKYTD